jgi:hypothetical protein
MIFLELLKKSKVNWIKRNIIYSAVRLGGGIPWARHKIDGILEARKYCTIQRV